MHTRNQHSVFYNLNLGYLSSYLKLVKIYLMPIHKHHLIIKKNKPKFMCYQRYMVIKITHLLVFWSLIVSINKLYQYTEACTFVYSVLWDSCIWSQTTSKRLYDSHKIQTFLNNIRTEVIFSIIKQRILVLIKNKKTHTLKKKR